MEADRVSREWDLVASNRGDLMGTFITIAERVQFELARIKGSRFIADAADIQSVDDVQELLAVLRTQFPGASHHCWAYRLRSGQECSSDDGEPSGTAGRPILNHLRGGGLQNAVIVVTRFFGGTKLGSGGLVRAYSAAAAAILERATLTTCHQRLMFSVVFGYDVTSAVRGALTAADACIVSESFTDNVTIHVSVPVESVDQLDRELLDRTSGTISLQSISLPQTRADHTSKPVGGDLLE